ncbi:hypothetical protein BH20ACI4_BH20ACI4_17690 [soil metagenome]
MNLVKGKENDDPKLKFAPLALSDIKDTWQYISEQGEAAAERVIREIIKKCELLCRNPKIGRERNDLIIDLRLFPYKNYNIFYFIIDDGVEIYRVLHSSRDVIQIFDDVIDDTI